MNLDGLDPYRPTHGEGFTVLPGRSPFAAAKPVLKVGLAFALGVAAMAMAAVFIGAAQ